VKAALRYEIKRQTEALEKGEKISQETRLWDDDRQKTFPMRSKEEAHDYRYFPEPDLVPFFVTQAEIEKERASLPELPKQKKERFMREYEISAYDAALLTEDVEIADFFERTIKEIIKQDSKAVAKALVSKSIANWITGALFAYFGEHGVTLDATPLKEKPHLLASIDLLVRSGMVSLQTAKEKIFIEVMKSSRDPNEVMEELGLKQVSDELSLEKWIEEIVRENPKVIADFKSGKDTAAMFLVGQVMRKSKGKANPGMVQALIRKRLA